MPHKKTKPPAEPVMEQTQTSTAIAELPSASDDKPTIERPAWVDGPVPEVPEPAAMPTDGTGRNYGPPYKALFTSPDKGFELGENRRFRQRVFTFKERPSPDVIDRLKQHGFTYRAAEKAWTVEATAESRVLTDRLARELAGPEQSAGRE